MNDEMMTMNPVEYSRQGQRHIKRRAIDEEINEFFSKQLPAIIRRIETLEKAQQIEENIDKISWALPRNA